MGTMEDRNGNPITGNNLRDGGAHADVIAWDHGYIHDGKTFHASLFVDNLADSAAKDVVFTCGSTQEAHTLITCALGGEALVQIYEAPTMSGGSQMTPYNRKRSSTTAAGASLVSAPSVTATGTLLETVLLVGGVGPRSVGGSSGTRLEWVFKRSTRYLIRVTNQSGGAKDGSIALDWYEHN